MSRILHAYVTVRIMALPRRQINRMMTELAQADRTAYYIEDFRSDSGRLMSRNSQAYAMSIIIRAV